MRLQLRTKVWLERDGTFVIGDGGLRLLVEIEGRGSLLAAAREIGWSYRHAWQYLRRAEQALGLSLVQARPGKGRRRGTVLTREGRRLRTMLHDARARVDRVVAATGPTSEEIAARGGPRPRSRRRWSGAPRIAGASARASGTMSNALAWDHLGRRQNPAASDGRKEPV